MNSFVHTNPAIVYGSYVCASSHENEKEDSEVVKWKPRFAQISTGIWDLGHSDWDWESQETDEEKT